MLRPLLLEPLLPVPFPVEPVLLPLLVLSLGNRRLKTSRGCSKKSRRLAARLRDTNEVQDQKHRHGESRNVTHR